MPIAILLTGGQRNDGAVFTEVIDEIRVPRPGPGRPRTRPDAVIADKAYSNSIIRDYLSTRGIKAVIPQKSNEKTSRQRRGSAGGRPPAFNAGLYKGRNVVERHTLREAGHHLPGHRSPLRNRGLATQIGDMP